jgi:hypothetical protein
MAITALPPAPDRNVPSTFPDLADAWAAALGTFTTEANALQADVNAKQLLAAASQLAALASQTAAAASEAAAINATAAPLWVSGTTYAIGNIAWSPANGLIYRRRTSGAGTTDPSLDSTNWVSIAVLVIADWLSGATYQQNQLIISPVSGALYRRTSATGSGTTDPSGDSANYSLVGAAVPGFITQAFGII